jgi:hypothetical protein
MATSSLQQARQRKMIYFGAIVVLLTISLIHRDFFLKPLAFALQLRETSRGEVELTWSAVRKLMTGSRGLAVTFLWYNAMDLQKRNEWNELELICKSITKLQPYFIRPWLYQSWNIAFNVAVECDQPRDKYHYISRGLELLAEGERRNRGTGDEDSSDPKKRGFPGNPDMRYYMGFTYQLKIGTSDERLTMRSFLEMSCIDPVHRNPAKWWIVDEEGRRRVDLVQFKTFCEKYPRLVRRLREQLEYSDPERIAKFLQDHKDIPNRFKPAALDARQSELKSAMEQFPILPPYQGNWPNPDSYDLTTESPDVFLVSRTWYEYSQKPLPPPNPTPGVTDPDYDKMKYRVPGQMVIQLFRHYPPRAQVYIAETLESEGWFDGDGWKIEGWFDPLLARQSPVEKAPTAAEASTLVGLSTPTSGPAAPLTVAGMLLPSVESVEPELTAVGTEEKYQSQRAWDKGHRMYKQYGLENGLLIEPAELAHLRKQAVYFQKMTGTHPDAMPLNIRSNWREGELGESMIAHLRIRYSEFYRHLANFDAFYLQSQAEADPLLVSVRKLIHQAEPLRKHRPSEAMLGMYEEAWAKYVQLCLKYPRLVEVSSMQEDMCEVHQYYLRAVQDLNKDAFRRTAVAAALWPSWPFASWPETVSREALVTKKMREPQAMINVVPIRNRRGILDATYLYNVAGANDLRAALRSWMLGAELASLGVTGAVSVPEQQTYLLTKVTFTEQMPPEWRSIIHPDVLQIVMMRPGLAPR